MKIKVNLTKSDLKVILGEMGTFIDSYDPKMNKIGTKKEYEQSKKTFKKLKKIADSIGGF